MDENREKTGKSKFNPFNIAKNLSQRSVHMDISGNSEIVLEGCRGVLEYNDSTVKVNTGAFVLSIMGRGIVIKCYTEASMVIQGYITMIEFIS